MTAFGVWLIAQVGRSDAVGDLARQYDRPVPGRMWRRYSPAGVKAEMEGADPEALAALNQAVAEWRETQR